jgi:hypothetical protein
MPHPALAVLPLGVVFANAGVVNLRFEQLQKPLGIDAPKPRLSWELEYATRGEKQISSGVNTTLPFLMQLTGWSYNETAYKLSESRRLPSWYCIDKGATTIWGGWWEGFDKPSFNHCAFGAVGEWFYRVIPGIYYDKSQPSIPVTGRRMNGWDIAGGMESIRAVCPESRAARATANGSLSTWVPATIAFRPEAN